MKNVIDITAFVAPISTDNPVGKDIREESTLTNLYYQIKDARNGARTTERKNQTGESDVDPKPQWDIVFKVGSDILQKHSKDIEIAAWLTEALIRRNGFAGLANGFTLLKELVNQYWDAGVYPLPDEEGIEIRVAPIAGLNGVDAEGSLLFPIRNAKLTANTSSGCFSLWQYKQAIELESIKDEKAKQRKIDQGITLPANVYKAVAESGKDFYQALLSELTQTITAFAALNAALQEKCGKDAPGSSQIRNALDDVKDHIGFLLKDAPFAIAPVAVQALEVVGTTTAEQVVDGSVAEPQKSVTGTRGLNSRKDALQLLSQVATYFKTNEPHSPLAYSIERLVRWGNLPLPELMRELIDDGARNNFEKLTGVMAPSADVPK